MASTSVQRETITRKALRLYPERIVEPLGHGRYSVEGTEETYAVDLGIFNGGVETCPCPATKPCYHISMATIYRAKTSAAARRRSSRPRFSPEAIAANLARMSA